MYKLSIVIYSKPGSYEIINLCHHDVGMIRRHISALFFQSMFHKTYIVQPNLATNPIHGKSVLERDCTAETFIISIFRGISIHALYPRQILDNSTLTVLPFSLLCMYTVHRTKIECVSAIRSHTSTLHYTHDHSRPRN
jgi:hypothetical protein